VVFFDIFVPALNVNCCNSSSSRRRTKIRVSSNSSRRPLSISNDLRTKGQILGSLLVTFDPSSNFFHKIHLITHFKPNKFFKNQKYQPKVTTVVQARTLPHFYGFSGRFEIFLNFAESLLVVVATKFKNRRVCLFDPLCHTEIGR